MTITSQLNRLVELSKTLDIEKFYTISVKESELTLQGEYSSGTIEALTNNGFPIPVIIPASGYAETNKDNIIITLT